MSWPVQPPPGANPVDAVAAAKPKWFDAIVILALVLAGFGILGGLSAVVMLFAASGGGGMFMPDIPDMPPEMLEMQQELQKKIYQASMPRVSAAIGLVNLAVCGYALWSGILMLKRKVGACAHFVRAMLVLGAMEIVGALFALVLQSRIWRIMTGFMGDMMEAGSGGTPVPQQVKDTMEMTMQIGIIVGIIFAIGWSGLKIGFCFYARHYGSKPEVEVFVEGAQSAA